VRDISRLPSGRFIKMTLRHLPDGLSGLPSSGPQVLMFGCGPSGSNAYLAATPAPGFASGEGTRYLAGVTAGNPQWSDKESDAAPLFDHPVMADISVIYESGLGLWLMLYNNPRIQPTGMVFRYAARPWGPWSDPQVVFNVVRDGAAGVFIHDPNRQPDDGLAGPVTGQADPQKTAGAPYAPYFIERFTRVQGARLTLHFLMSIWNP
jgi:hypothetical protein